VECRLVLEEQPPPLVLVLVLVLTQVPPLAGDEWLQDWASLKV